MQPVDILLIGTTHLDNPGRDVHNVEVDDVLSSRGGSSPESRRNALAPYMEHNLWINRPGNWVGAEMVGNWYLRNMRIAGTLDRLVEPGDRVLVLYGAGHAPLLEEFWGWNPRMRFVDPLEYLPA